MDDKRIGAAPDYTNAAITMLGVNMMWIMLAVWMLWGIVPVLILAVFVNHFVEHLSDRRGITPAFGHIRVGRAPNKGPRD